MTRRQPEPSDALCGTATHTRLRREVGGARQREVHSSDNWSHGACPWAPSAERPRCCAAPDALIARGEGSCFECRIGSCTAPRAIGAPPPPQEWQQCGSSVTEQGQVSKGARRGCRDAVLCAADKCQEFQDGPVAPPSTGARAYRARAPGRWHHASCRAALGWSKWVEQVGGWVDGRRRDAPILIRRRCDVPPSGRARQDRRVDADRTPPSGLTEESSALCTSLQALGATFTLVYLFFFPKGKLVHFFLVFG